MSVGVAGLDGGRFAAAWQAVADHHAILRTGFAWEGLGEPLQYVLRSAELPVRQIDWRGCEVTADMLAGLAHDEQARGFDLGQPPLMRVLLVRVADDAYRLIWTYHHVLLDGWSVSQLIGDVLRHYRGQPLAPSGRYGTYIDWLRRQDAEATERFWRRRLAGARGADPSGRVHAAGPARGRPRGRLHALGPGPHRAARRLRARAADHRQHARPGGVAAAAPAPYRPAHGGLRRHGLGPAGRAAGCAHHAGPVHQHAAGDRGPPARPSRRRGLAARAPGRQPGAARARARAPAGHPALGRPRGPGAVRQHHRVREPPDRPHAA